MDFGPYQLAEEIGRGAAGTVYKARGPGGAWVAIKRLHKGAELRRFAREQQVQAELGREHGFVPIVAAGESPEGAWLAMPLLEGGTLRERLRAGPLPLAALERLGRALARALGRAHQRGFVHRDLKPENILFDGADQPLVADLGIAKHLGGDAQLGLSRSLSATGETRGTIGYLAPECVKDSKHASPAADVFALGAILYECATGRPPFEGRSTLDVLSRLARGAFAPLARERPDLPRALRQVIERCLAPRPDQRFPHGDAAAEALEGAASIDRRALTRRRALRLVGLLLAAVVGGAALSMWGRRVPEPTAKGLAQEHLQERSGTDAPEGEGASVNRHLCLALTLFSFPPLLAQAEEPVRPAPVRVAELRGNGHAETWDGRLFIITQTLPGGGAGWVARILRPERITRGAQGRPRFVPGVFSPISLVHGDINAGTIGLTQLNALALTPWPGVAQNPYPSDGTGRALETGAFETYDLLVMTQRYAPRDARLGRLRYRIVVRNPRTRDARVERVERVSSFRPLTQTNGRPLRGIEPTLTVDSHLMIWQGKPSNDGTIDTLVYSFNQNPGALGRWSPPRSVADMYHVDRQTVVAGLPFEERFPLAQRPLFANVGTPFRRGQLYFGAYPWVSQDGSELFHTSTIAGQAGVNRARRGGLAVIGRLTGWTMRHLDGPLNPDRERTLRLFTSSPGLTPGMWTPYRDTPNRIPAGAQVPLYPLFGSNTADYADVDMSDAGDGEYTTALRMNEAVDALGRIDPQRTPDSSGVPRVGTLRGGAAFPQERGLPDANVGHVGQAIFFPQRGAVDVDNLAQSRNALTVSLWIKRLASLAGDADNRYLLVANHPGAWQLILEENGKMHVAVRSGGAFRRTGAVGRPLALDTWTHVSFTYRAGGGRLEVWINGARVESRAFGAGSIDVGQGRLIVGPGGQRPLAPMVPANQPVMLLDELTVSRVVRTPRELRAAAFRRVAPPRSGPALGVRLPEGIPASALQIPSGAATSQAAADLGEVLFSDPRLSLDGSVSCASCHKPAQAFTDGLPLARGVRGAVGQRNTPTILNRALSQAQFLDGRAGSLEQQALLPIEHPAEMRLPLAQAVRRLASSPTYTARFRAAFGRGPDPQALSAALAAFQRQQVFGDSRVDRFEAGDRSALTPAEARGRVLFQGKARCVACHSGPNFSDERFHATAATQSTTDLGREAVTGRRSDRGRFKTPTLRALGRTAPYLHDGSVASLAEVIERYDRGGLRRADRDIEIRPLNLSSGEKRDLLAFLRALEGPSTARPAPTLPTDVQFTPPPATARELWVGRVYRSLLGRAPGASEVAARVASLAAGRSPVELAREVARSPEALRARVRGLYRTYLKRRPAPRGLTAQVARARAGLSLSDHERSLVLSKEYQDAAPGNRAWVSALYRDILGRAPDAGGLANNMRTLAARPSARGDVARAILRSRERHTRWTNAIYAAAAGRAPTSSERAAAVSALAGGLALEELPVRVLAATAP